MNKLASLIIRCRGLILALFIVLSLISGYLATKVQTNFDLSSYLPKDVASTVAIETMMDEYQQDIPNVEVGIPDLTISEALEAKASLAALPFVKEVLWLDDQLDLAKPLDLHDQKVVEGFYKEGMALYHITVDEDAKALPFAEAEPGATGLELLLSLAATHDAIVTVEEGAIMGGAGSAVCEALNAAGVTRPVLQLGLPDVFIEHGDPAKLLALQGLDAEGIARAVRQRFAQA